MKVLIANKFFFRNGGSEVVMFQERAFLNEAGVDVVDFSMKDDRNLETPYAEYFVENRNFSGTPNPLSGLNLVHSAEAVRKVGKLIDDTRPDLMHCHNVYHQLTPSIIGAAAKRGVPVVLTLHDYKPICPIYTCLRGTTVCSECTTHGPSRVLKHRCAGGSLGRSAVLYAEAVFHRWRGSYEKLAAVIAPSEFMRRAVVGARFPPSKVHILRNGIDTESIRSSPRDAGYVLYVGRLSNGKGIESLLEAHAPLSGEIPLVVAGTGPLEADLRADYPEVRFLGHLVGSALERVLQHASVVVIPSNWYENAPMSVLEAMAHGKPVVGANIGGIPEMIHHEETGLLFPPENREALRACLVRLIADPALRKRLGTAGRKLAESKFSLERHNQALLNLYSKILTRTDGEPQPAAMALPQRMGPWT